MKKIMFYSTNFNDVINYFKHKENLNLNFTIKEINESEERLILSFSKSLSKNVLDDLIAGLKGWKYNIFKEENSTYLVDVYRDFFINEL